MLKLAPTAFLLFAISLFSPAVTNAQPPQIAPKGDHHQHIFSPAAAEFSKLQQVSAQDVVKLLDAAGIERAVLLSYAYAFGRPGREPRDEYEKVKQENDWVGAQAALFPKRLIAFCGFNPLKDYALAEIARCAKDPNLRRGIKLHFGNSDVQLENPEHIEKLKAVFRAAAANRMAIVAHIRASFSLNRPYGAEQGRAFLEHLLPAAGDSMVQVAHLGSSGPGYDDPQADAVMDVLIEAITKRDPRTRNLWFDLTSNVNPGNPPARTARVIDIIRRIGPKRILYGTDAALGDNLRPRESWAEVARLALSKKEIETIAKNRAPYLR
jgi:predicted TIM-barrel fold metal-dependent hydrolase